MTVTELRTKFLTGDYTPEQAASDSLAIIESKDSDIHAYLEVFTEVNEAAKEATKAFKKDGEKTPALCGIPIAIKNNILIKDKKLRLVLRFWRTIMLPTTQR